MKTRDEDCETGGDISFPPKEIKDTERYSYKRKAKQEKTRIFLLGFVLGIIAASAVGLLAFLLIQNRSTETQDVINKKEQWERHLPTNCECNETLTAVPCSSFSPTLSPSTYFQTEQPTAVSTTDTSSDTMVPTYLGTGAEDTMVPTNLGTGVDTMVPTNFGTGVEDTVVPTNFGTGVDTMVPTDFGTGVEDTVVPTNFGTGADTMLPTYLGTSADTDTFTEIPDFSTSPTTETPTNVIPTEPLPVDEFTRIFPDYTIRAILQDRDSPQSLAYRFLHAEQAQNLSDWRILQRFALATLWHATGGPTWKAKSDWSKTNWLDPGAHECSWFTYHARPCDADGQYLHLSLRYHNLTGQLPLELYLLTTLENVDFSRNPFVSNTIPTDIANLTKLESFIMADTHLYGTIPTEIGELHTSLDFLDLSNNMLSGSICSDIGRLTNINLLLSLQHNNLHGSIPSELGNHYLLKYLNLRGNQLSGWLPSELGRLDMISLFPESLYSEFDISDNEISGVMPTELGLISGVAKFNVSYNQFGADLPTELFQLTNLAFMSIEHNYMSTRLPTEIGKMTELQYLSASYNSLHRIPTEMGMLANSEKLSFLDLGYNSFRGSIVTELFQVTSLTELNLEHNRFHESLSTLIGKLTKLSSLSLANNALEGLIPSELGLLTSLIKLDLSDNNFTDTVPLELQVMRANTNGSSISPPLDISGNFGLSGSIPQVLCADSWDRPFIDFDCSDTLCGCSDCSC